MAGDFLDVQKLSIRLDDKIFIYDFSCAKGECVGILGPSGSGKTTFFRGLTGLERAMSGSIHLDGADITRVQVHKRRIALMFQDYAIFENLTVERNLKFVLLANRIRHSKWSGMIGDILQFTGLSDKRKQMSGTLSGGEKQRLALARCLIIPPKVLLLDEPFNSLDSDMKASIAERLSETRRKFGITVLIISHDESDFTKLLSCDRIVRIEDMLKHSQT